uniref:Uncharacterized protein n=1 Tax=Cacopsylla melanoneura TaxID=428564 RepID=A0A8D8ZBE3_9HEMI
MTLNPATSPLHISLFCLLLLSCPLDFTHAQPSGARNEASSAKQNAEASEVGGANAPAGEANAPVGGPNSVGGASNQAVVNKKPSEEVEEITYDQRQNGTQNVRIHLDDVTLLLAPSESLAGLFATQQVASALAGQNPAAFAQNASAAHAQNEKEQNGGNAEEGVEEAAEEEEVTEKQKPLVEGAAQGGAPVAAASDPYADFNELLSAANFLKKAAAGAQKGQLQGQQQHGVAAGHPGAKRKVCTGPRCTAKR